MRKVRCVIDSFSDLWSHLRAKKITKIHNGLRVYEHANPCGRSCRKMCQVSLFLLSDKHFLMQRDDSHLRFFNLSQTRRMTRLTCGLVALTRLWKGRGCGSQANSCPEDHRSGVPQTGKFCSAFKVPVIRV